MSLTWESVDPPPRPRVTPLGWALVALRLPAVALLIFGLLPVFLLVRAVERPLCGSRRPASPRISRFALRNALRVMGLRLRVEGRPMGVPGAIVANHSSWLDIFALNGGEPVYFVAKEEVARWPGIGFGARAIGTLFVRRDRRDARNQQQALERRLLAGHHLCFFPEGTSTDGRRVLPFKSTLFSAFLHAELRERLWIQPVSVTYHPPAGADPRLYGWWGDMDFATHLVRIMGHVRRGDVVLNYRPPLRVADFADRKALAQAAGESVRVGVEEALVGGSAHGRPEPR